MDSDERPTAELLRDGFRWFAQCLEIRSAAAGEPDLSPGAAMTMSYLDAAPVKPSDLARRMQVSRQRVHAVLRELSAAGLVELVRDPTSGRDKLIRVTPAGKRRLRRVAAALAELDQRAAEQLGAEDLALLRQLLIRLVAIPRPR
ncbi:MarR family winged helix-turn-helix transcriptional regulator [Mycobacterium avium]|uniref:MarR-family protein transcriptional regulator n=1 Tax=Mycobacterium avium (strain 104) TaxID=243243 RepID=A0A0H2ZVJ1_MYCA1|nr:MarR family winged helix-turn-helix transcriptional regulator [Mycobacterium avium]ABK65709.1 MarR-family protein transcriptional regulator [Mycobacterium avium 104]MCG3242812.1 winged helix-turn-helix transcriptional regulator [Mycobacterium avium subsp. hominissuis]